MITTLLAAALSLSATAVDAIELREMTLSHSPPGWSKQGRSLVLYDVEGLISFEIGLVREENGAVTHEVLGAASPDGAAAWTLERTLTWNPSRNRMIESRRMLKIYGSSGLPLWTDPSVDWPEKGDPAVFSKDSKIILISCRLGESWGIEARDWAGGTMLKAGPFPRVVSIALSPAGHYAVARWSVPDKSDTHSFFDLRTKARKDIETSELTLGLARIGDDGVVRSGRREVLSFDAAASSAAAPGSAPP